MECYIQGMTLNLKLKHEENVQQSEHNSKLLGGENIYN